MALDEGTLARDLATLSNALRSSNDGTLHEALDRVAQHITARACENAALRQRVNYLWGAVLAQKEASDE